MAELVVCVDFGSTFTKAALVSLADGKLVATASHPTTLDTDVLDGWDACRALLVAVQPGAADAEVLACSSAGGGLRIVVVGNEELVSAEAGRRVALSSGGRVVGVFAGRPDLELLGATAPDVVLLVGGTDGGNSEVLLSCAEALASAEWPVVVAGNIDARPVVEQILDRRPYVVADNVVPRIGVLAPDSARAAVRQLFLSHVIGGKHLSTRAEFARMVRGATPDVVLTAVEMLGDQVGDVVVVDVGGATTDVHSVVEPDPDSSGREVVATSRVSRTVEGDLGLRWSAVSTVEEGYAAGLFAEDEIVAARVGATRRQASPSYVADSEAARNLDLRIASTAIGVALRRHAGRAQVVFSPTGRGQAPGRVVERTGKDLREVKLLVGSGGILRHAGAEATSAVGEHLGAQGGWQLPDRPRIVVDTDYVLAAAGLLAADHPEAARGLLRALAAPRR